MKIAEYKEFARELNKPKTYEFNIALEGFEKEIKRKVLAESTMNLDDFCRYIVYSMRGDLSHMYTLKRGKEYLDEDVLQARDLNYLRLEKGQRLKLVYDMGDNWTFKITVAKIIDGFTGDRKFKVISGKGYGIIDDCGGTYGLYNIFIGKNKDWGVYDINNFDLDEINMRVDFL